MIILSAIELGISRYSAWLLVVCQETRGIAGAGNKGGVSEHHVPRDIFPYICAVNLQRLDCNEKHNKIVSYVGGIYGLNRKLYGGKRRQTK